MFTNKLCLLPLLKVYNCTVYAIALARNIERIRCSRITYSTFLLKLINIIL